MKWSYIVIAAAAAAAGSSPVLADDVTTAGRVMREALLERAPVPSRPPALPDRTAPGALTRDQLAATRMEAERAARRHAEKDASAAEVNRTEMANRAAMAPMMRGCSATGSADACAGGMPADMMKSRGKMAGGGMMPGGSMPGTSGMPSGGGMPGGGGMAGSGMLHSGAASPVAAPSQPPGGVRR